MLTRRTGGGGVALGGGSTGPWGVGRGGRGEEEAPAVGLRRRGGSRGVEGLEERARSCRARQPPGPEPAPARLAIFCRCGSGRSVQGWGGGRGCRRRPY